MALQLRRFGCHCLAALREGGAGGAAAAARERATSSSSLRSSIIPPSLLPQRAALSTKAGAADAAGGKKGKGKDEGAAPAAAAAPVGDVTKVAPVNIYKDGQDPPLQPDDQYPEWLFEIRPLTLPEYRKMDVSKLPLKEQRRYWKLLNRQVIKEKNAAGQKL